MTDNLCAHSTRRWRQKAMTGRAEGGRYRRECAPRSRYFQADQRYVAARLCSCVFGLGHLRLLAALCAIPPIAVLAQGTAVPLVGSHGAAGLVRLIVTLMPIALLLPHAGPASSGRHAVALMTGRHQAESKMRPATLSYQSSLDLQRLPRARINNLHTTFAYHIPIPLQKESIILIYRYHTGKCRTLGLEWSTAPAPRAWLPRHPAFCREQIDGEFANVACCRAEVAESSEMMLKLSQASPTRLAIAATAAVILGQATVTPALPVYLKAGLEEAHHLPR